MFTQAETDRELTLWAETDRMDKPQGGTQTTSPFFLALPSGCQSAVVKADFSSIFQYNAKQNNGKTMVRF